MRNAPRRVIAIVAAVVTTLGLVPAAAFADPTIDHDPVQCIVAGSYPEFIANFSPSAEVASARLYFKASDTPDWYWVPFNTESAGGWKAVLPKPSPSLRQIDYYLSVFDPQNRPSNGNQYHPVVSTRTYCENQALTVAQPVDLEGIELAVGLVRVAQQVIPSGFFSEGIATTILADGTAVATSTAAQASSTAAAGGTSSSVAPGAAGSTAAAGGGLSTTAWVLGGVALAGGAAYAVSESQKDDSGGSSDSGALPCNQQTQSGGDTPVSLAVNLGKRSGTFGFLWQMQSVRDQMRVVYEGRQLFDTGCVSGSGSRSLSFSGSSRTVTINVQPNCAGGSNTYWEFTVTCP